MPLKFCDTVLRLVDPQVALEVAVNIDKFAHVGSIRAKSMGQYSH